MNIFEITIFLRFHNICFALRYLFVTTAASIFSEYFFAFCSPLDFKNCWVVIFPKKKINLWIFAWSASVGTGSKSLADVALAESEFQARQALKPSPLKDDRPAIQLSDKLKTGAAKKRILADSESARPLPSRKMIDQVSRSSRKYLFFSSRPHPSILWVLGAGYSVDQGNFFALCQTRFRMSLFHNPVQILF